MQRQFHIQKCELGRLHSKKAIGVLSEIWRAVPMAVAKSIPNAVADEKKLRDVLAQCGAVEAVRIVLGSIFCAQVLLTVQYMYACK